MACAVMRLPAPRESTRPVSHVLTKACLLRLACRWWRRGLRGRRWLFGRGLYCRGYLRRQGCRYFGMRGGVKVDAVPLIKIPRHRIRIVDDDADAAGVQPLLHRLDIS